ncbi:hypothetical protein CONLIGDRAFT_703801 [Coniochaeta ligniaria NRRL 30616]|uniref:G domain-containing protein n=1 Tax=Coniochaeta ligniaria NRRL 30616 TaxID=1408157 RepID=A0A1J7JLX5_9PEZI|nr:hypothetical protein CONLIGDRAFT_703801 [Coniochaeta ligniaria NRRL 30616]
MGLTGFNCSCGQRPVTVVLVGCTQHGKSSLIRAIFDYAGLKKDGDNVKIGAYGNSSTTKDCTTFDILVRIREHFIRDDAGKVRTIKTNSFTPQDVSDLMNDAAAEFSHTSGKHVHLRIIDTPGLDDTDNANASRKKGYKAFQGAMPLRVIDEKHKMSILKTVATVGHVNSVCFVISSQSPLNFSLQGLLKEYIDIFKMSSLNKSYHFLHTKVDAEALFDTNTKARPSHVSGKLGLYSAKHHFMENLPDPNDPVSVFFAHQAMAKWLTDLSSDSPQPVTSLKYPKSDGLKTMDDTLRMGVDIDLNYYQDQVSKQSSNITSLEAKVRRLSARRDVQNRNWSELVGKISRLNTTDLVEIESRYGYERSHFFSRSRLYWTIYAEHTIRKITRDPVSPKYSTWTSYDDSARVGTTLYTNGLTSDSSNTEINGTVKLYAWKKDVEADEIKRLTSEKDEAYSEWQGTLAELKEAETDITESKSQIKANEEQVTKCRARKALLSPTSIAPAAIKTNGAYFSTCSLISYAFAVGLTENKIYQFHFPTVFTDGSATRAKSRYGSKARVAESMVQTCEAMVSSLDGGVKSIDRAIADLASCEERIGKSITQVQKSMSDELREWTPSSQLTRNQRLSYLSAEEAKAKGRVIDLLRAEFRPLLDTGREQAEDVMAEHGELLVARQALAKTAATKMKEMKGQYAEVRSRWAEKKVDAQASLAAASVMRDKLTVASWFTLGPFGVLKEAIDEFGADSDNVWDALFYHVREAYLDDPGRFNDVLETF